MNSFDIELSSYTSQWYQECPFAIRLMNNEATEKVLLLYFILIVKHKIVLYFGHQRVLKHLSTEIPEIKHHKRHIATILKIINYSLNILSTLFPNYHFS